MERYGEVVLYAMPFFFILIVIEKLYGIKKGEDLSPVMDMVSGIQSGITNAVKDVLGLGFSLISYGWLLNYLAVTTVAPSWWVYVLVFMVLDFQGYWVHRWAHEINFFWNKHLIHHSSEEFNLACALRQSVSSFINLFTFFLLPCALLGVPHLIIAVVAPLHLFAQFWYHTRHIGKMGFLEKVIVTPSHHRVHHAINPEYLDKNYGQIFIFWDKWFGTFQEELPNVPAVYGITRPVRTWNPIKINFQHLFLMLHDSWYAEKWGDKFRLWWQPTGWRPADVATRFPLKKIEDIYHYEKYNPPVSKGLKTWAMFQLVAMLLLSAHFFGNIAAIGSPDIFVYGLFLFVSVYSTSELMDKNKGVIFWETLRGSFGFALLLHYNSWFGLEQWRDLVGVYLLISWGIAVWFGIKSMKPSNRTLSAET